MSSTSGVAAWQPALHLGGDQWVGLGHDGEVFVGDHEHAKRRVESQVPIGLLPLLERPYAVIAAEIEDWEANRHQRRGFLAASLPLESLVVHALGCESNYWAALAVEWVAAMPSAHGFVAAMEALESATWASQEVRHLARKVRRAVNNSNATGEQSADDS